MQLLELYKLTPCEEKNHTINQSQKLVPANYYPVPGVQIVECREGERKEKNVEERERGGNACEISFQKGHSAHFCQLVIRP